MRKTLSDRGVAALKPRAARYAVADPELRGMWIRVQPSGAKAFYAVTRGPDGKQHWISIGPTDAMPIATARERARDILGRVRAGLPAIEPLAETFGKVAEQWIVRHVERNGLRSQSEIKRLVRVHVLPVWRDREFTSIRRSDVAALLDRVEDRHSARQADGVLDIIRGLMNWHATRSDDYSPPIVRGMRRQSQHARARARVLDDGELRAIWRHAETFGTFGAFVQMCLLTAQRSRKVVAMRWADITIDGEWTIAAEPREKSSAGSLVLPEAALAIIRARPRLASNPFIFAGRGDHHYRALSRAKERFDAALPDLAPWVIHDLRRTARSLMSRAGVLSEHAERVLGHAIRGVEGVYDRHSYREEKAEALRKLADLTASLTG